MKRRLEGVASASFITADRSPSVQAGPFAAGLHACAPVIQGSRYSLIRGEGVKDERCRCYSRYRPLSYQHPYVPKGWCRASSALCLALGAKTRMTWVDGAAGTLPQACGGMHTEGTHRARVGTNSRRGGGGYRTVSSGRGNIVHSVIRSKQRNTDIACCAAVQLIDSLGSASAQHLSLGRVHSTQRRVRSTQGRLRSHGPRPGSLCLPYGKRFALQPPAFLLHLLSRRCRL